ncbi:MAG: hypothetical protein QXS37_06825 [Candidatus Aenigmatarchaeota archaeon]
MGKSIDIDEKREMEYYRAEVPMYSLDYMRYHELLKKADELAILVLSGDASAIKYYYSCLLTIYINFRPLFLKGVDLTIRDRIKLINELFKEWEAKNTLKIKYFPKALAEELFILHAKLLVLKQKVGLGLRLEKEESFFRKLSKVSSLA